MRNRSTRIRQLVDWSAAVWAGCLAGTVFLLTLLFVVPRFEGGNARGMLRLLASPVLGGEVLAPPATFHGASLAVGLLIHFTLSIGFSLVLAAIIHRWGLLVGVVGGAMFGVALYAVNFYTMTLMFPWFFAMRSNAMVVAHVLFGALAGGIYEGLEVEEFEPIPENAA